MEQPPCPPGDTRPECAYHKGLPAVARCVRCNRMLCAACRVLMGNRNYCRPCAQAAMAGVPPPQYVYPPGAQAPPYVYRPGAQAPPYVYRPAREEVFPDTPWSLGEALVIFFIAWVIASAFSAGFYIYMSSSRSITVSDAIILLFISSVILYVFLLSGTFYSVKVRHGSSPSAIGLRFDGFGKGMGLGLALGIPLFIGAILLGYLSQYVMGPTKSDYMTRSMTEALRGSVSPGLIVLLFVTLVVLAPVCEEIFFRGYLYPTLRNRMNMQPAMVVNGVLFAAAHLQLVGFLPRLLLGYGLSYLYEKNRTLGGPIVGHALYNGLIVVLSLF